MGGKRRIGLVTEESRSFKIPNNALFLKLRIDILVLLIFLFVLTYICYKYHLYILNVKSKIYT